MAEDRFETEIWLTLDELSRATRVPGPWLAERVAAGLIAAEGDAARGWRLDAQVLRRVRSMQHIESCFGAVPELAALVADLEDEIDRLRRQLHGGAPWR